MTEGFAGPAAGRLFNRQSALLWLAAAGLLCVALIHLGTQPGGLSPAEVASANHSRAFHSIAKGPVNAPHDILSLAFGRLGGTFALRLASSVWGVIFAVGFFSVSKAWFGKTIGLVGAVILATTPLFLVSARQSSPGIMLMAPVLIMALYIWLSRSPASKARTFFLLVLLGAIMLYVPGMVWWLAGGAVAGRRKLQEATLSIPRSRVYLSLAAGLAVIVPLIIVIAGNWRLAETLALVPAHFTSPLTEVKDIGWMVSAWFVKAPFHSQLIIARLPLLNIVQDVLLAFGAFALFQAAKNKAWPLVAAMAFATLAAGLNNDINLLLLGLPAAGLFMTAGLRYLYVEWRGVFPRNPAAKYAAILMICVLGAVQLLFGVRYALVAWPHTIATHNTYVIRLDDRRT